MDEEIETMVRLLKEKRRQRSMTQEEVALKAGVTVQQIRRIEKGSNIPSAILIARLAKIYRESTDYFLRHVKTGEERIEELWGRVQKSHARIRAYTGREPTTLKEKKSLLIKFGYLQSRKGKRLV